METPTEVLLGCLKDLGSEEFEEFRWYLRQQGILEGFKPIPKCDLEKANRIKTLDLMVESYGINTIKVTRMILGKISQNDLVERLCHLPEPKGKSWKDSNVTKIFRNAQSMVCGLVLDSSRCFSSHPKVFFSSD